MIYGLPEQEYLAKGHNGCFGCGQLLAIRLALKACDKDTILVQATGCGEVTTTAYPLTSYRLPYIHGAFENAAAIASGIETALKKWSKKTKVLVMAGDGGTVDIGFQSLSGMLERGHNVCYICFDTEAYSNTGIQRSGATPEYASTTTTPAGKIIPGKKVNMKPIIDIIAAHNVPYVATACVSNPIDLFRKVKKGLEVQGPAYVHILTPCVPGWGYDSALSIKMGQLAVDTCFWPLYEIEYGKLKLNYQPKEKVKIEEWLKLQSRFKHIINNQQLITEVQKDIDKQWDKLIERNSN